MFHRFIVARGRLVPRPLALVAALAGLLSCAATASAAVSLRFGSSNATVTPNVDPNFTVRLFLDASTEETSGLNYRLESRNAATLAPVSNVFRIVSVNITQSPYNDFTATNPLTSPTLAPSNGANLGATVPNPIDDPLVAGSYLVADITLTVLNQAPGVYNLRTITHFAGEDWIAPDANGDLQGGTFSQHASMTITVLPEPSAIGASGLLALAGLSRRARRR
jgi:hypothetical protein